MRLSFLVLLPLLAACRMSEFPPDASRGSLSDTSMALARAGDPGWAYVQRASVDFDADGELETAVLISDVTLDAKGAPLWEDGHRWQVYIEEPTGERTYLLRKFLPNGSLSADVVRRDSGTRSILLVSRTPHQVTVHEIKYSGPERVLLVNAIERPIEQAGTFSGAPRP